MRIALISPFLSQTRHARTADGVPTYAQRLVGALMSQEQHLEIDVYATFRRGDNLHRRRSTAAIGDMSRTVTIESGFRVGYRGFMQILRAISGRKYEAIHLQHETFLYGGPLSLLAFPIFCLALRRFSNTVVTLHHVVSQKEVRGDFKRIHYTRIPLFLIRMGYRTFYRTMRWGARAVIVHHEHFCEILVKEYGFRRNRIAVIPHGISEPQQETLNPRSSLLERFKLPVSARTVFGFLGFAAGYKGIDALIQAFAVHARSTLDSTLLICAGEHPHVRSSPAYQEFLHSLRRAAAAIPGERVVWHGFLPEQQMSDFFRTIDCLVVPYTSSFGASGILAHAIAYGKPCIVSHQLSDLTRGAIVTETGESAIARALTQFSALSGEEREHLTHAFLSEQKEGSWDTVATSTLALYRALMPMTNKIFLLGAYGQRNLGDELLLAQCVKLLPRAACAAVSADPEHTAREHGVAALPRSGSPMRLLKAVWNARAIVVGGGDQFKLMKPMMRRSRYSLLILDALLASVARLCGKRLTFVGVGIGNIATPLARFLTRWTLRRAHAVLFRDARSFRMAQKLAPQADTALTADLAFLHTPPHPALSPRKGERGTHTLGIAPCAHMDQAEAYTIAMRAIGKGTDVFLGQNPERRAVFLPFQTGFAAHHDILVSQDILAHVLHTERCRIEEQLNMTTVDPLYASLDCLWGMRLHSLILATLHAVPFIALVYDVKVNNFLEEIGCTEWGIPVDASFQSEKLTELQSRLERRLPEIRRHLAMQAERLRTRARANADLLREIADACDPLPAALPSILPVRPQDHPAEST